MRSTSPQVQSSTAEATPPAEKQTQKPALASQLSAKGQPKPAESIKEPASSGQQKPSKVDSAASEVKILSPRDTGEKKTQQAESSKATRRVKSPAEERDAQKAAEPLKQPQALSQESEELTSAPIKEKPKPIKEAPSTQQAESKQTSTEEGKGLSAKPEGKDKKERTAVKEAASPARKNLRTLPKQAAEQDPLSASPLKSPFKASEEGGAADSREKSPPVSTSKAQHKGPAAEAQHSTSPSERSAETGKASSQDVALTPDGSAKTQKEAAASREDDANPAAATEPEGQSDNQQRELSESSDSAAAIVSTALSGDPQAVSPLSSIGEDIDDVETVRELASALSGNKVTPATAKGTAEKQDSKAAGKEGVEAINEKPASIASKAGKASSTPNTGSKETSPRKEGPARPQTSQEEATALLKLEES